ISLSDVAKIARAHGENLNTYYAWTREAMTFPNGAHIAEVEIDPETGRTALVHYVAVDDYGVLVNPMVASGQAHGAMAQGVGQALLERAAYDESSGQPLAASFMDYALPRADDLPALDLGFNATRCTTNPLGVKGTGEAGTTAAIAAVMNAVSNAIPNGAADHMDMPATPWKVWQACQNAGATK
ncbi:MAG: xanthine dehydrogenase family protein molybdopterin-binding subunit, partial [Pseudolabrys sp.]|nr:xanthine dehydrogenase family protein molybdopterin-binding subunit [Pseudolabrys sp.]